MERLTNDFLVLAKAAKSEVSAIPLAANEAMLASFSEFPAFNNFPFKIALIENEKGEVCSRFRQWDTAYDIKRWWNGIYNLDRLRIITEEYFFSESEKAELDKIWQDLNEKKLPAQINNDKALLLDTHSWELCISTKEINRQYRWNAATTDISIFVPLIETMRISHQHQQRLQK